MRWVMPMLLAAVAVTAVAGGASAATRNVIDYGADATGAADSSAAIQMAIDDTGRAGGGAVYLPAGTYLLEKALVVCDNLTLYGDGWASILKISPGSVEQAIATTRDGFYSYNIFLRDFQIDGNKDEVAVGPGQWGDEYTQSGITLGQVDGFTITRLHIHDCVHNGMYLTDSCRNFAVVDCHCIDNGKIGVTSGGRGICCGVSPRHFRIIGNYLSGNLRDQITVQSEGGDDADDWIIADNVIAYGLAGGIAVGDNIISQVVRMNINITDGIIANNAICANADDGIRIWSSASANPFGFRSSTSRILVSANMIHGNHGFGVYLEGVAPSEVSRISILNNSVLDNTLAGVLIADANCRNIACTGNTIAGNSGGDLADNSLPPAAASESPPPAPVPQSAEQPTCKDVVVADSANPRQGAAAFTPAGPCTIITCDDPDGCTLRIQEQAPRPGQTAILIFKGPHDCSVKGKAGVVELASPGSFGPNDTLQLIYSGDCWLETGRSNN